MCTVVVVWLAGIPVADKAVLHLAASLREAELIATAEWLERASDREAGSSRSTSPTEATPGARRVSPELAQLRATLLLEHVWRKPRRALLTYLVNDKASGRPYRRRMK